MIEDAGKPMLLVLVDWHIEKGRIYGYDRDGHRYISAALRTQHNATEGGRVDGVDGHTFVLGRPLGYHD